MLCREAGEGLPNSEGGDHGGPSAGLVPHFNFRVAARTRDAGGVPHGRCAAAWSEVVPDPRRPFQVSRCPVRASLVWALSCVPAAGGGMYIHGRAVPVCVCTAVRQRGTGGFTRPRTPPTRRTRTR
eukprot:COSAG01_NODE_723_length_14060_cov_132.571807_4_plen_126_part_00